MHKTPFESSYTGMTADGAQWLMDQHPSVQLVGIDYTSIAIFEDLPGAHNVLLPKVCAPLYCSTLSMHSAAALQCGAAILHMTQD